MKRYGVLILTVLFLLTLLPMSASAVLTEKLISSSTEYLEDGSYFVTNVYESAVQPRTGKTGYAEATYYSLTGTKVFVVTVDGSFDYTYGVSVKATSATASVSLYSTNASFVSKNAYTSGSSAVATGVVKYSDNTVSKTVTLTCDKYGNLSYS